MSMKIVSTFTSLSDGIDRHDIYRSQFIVELSFIDIQKMIMEEFNVVRLEKIEKNK